MADISSLMLDTTFEPEKFNFVRLDNMDEETGYDELRGESVPTFPHLYEYKSHDVVKGESDRLRYNIYLSIDGAFVTVWRGFCDPSSTENALVSWNKPDALNIQKYQEILFKGYIVNNQEAKVIFKAIDIEKVGSGAAAGCPQVLGNRDNKIGLYKVEEGNR